MENFMKILTQKRRSQFCFRSLVKNYTCMSNMLYNYCIYTMPLIIFSHPLTPEWNTYVRRMYECAALAKLSSQIYNSNGRLLLLKIVFVFCIYFANNFSSLLLLLTDYFLFLMLPKFSALLLHYTFYFRSISSPEKHIFIQCLLFSLPLFLYLVLYIYFLFFVSINRQQQSTKNRLEFSTKAAIIVG